MGYPHPDYLLRALTSKQVGEWKAYSDLEEFGQRHQDWHFGLLASMMANMFKGKGAKLSHPEDFVKPNRLDYEARVKKNTARSSGKAIKEFFKLFKKMQKQEDKNG